MGNDRHHLPETGAAGDGGDTSSSSRFATLEASAQDWDPNRYATHASFVPTLGGPVLHLLAPRPGERILDLGCGDGALTVALAEAGASVVGVDASPAQVAARWHAAWMPG